MSKEEKQIEEMAQDMYDSLPDYEHNYLDCRDASERMFAKGYCKQSEGEWVKVLNHIECSKCGYNAPYKKIKAGYHLRDLTRFCPNCGAKMKGGAE